MQSSTPRITGNTETIHVVCSFRSDLVAMRQDCFRIADHPEAGEKTSGAVRQLRELRNEWGFALRSPC